MEWEEKIPSRLNRLRIIRSSHLTGQVGQAGFFRQTEGGLSAGLTAPVKCGSAEIGSDPEQSFQII